MGAEVRVADNSGAKIVRIIAVPKFKNRHRQYPAATVGSLVVCAVQKGTPDMRRKIVKGVVVRQKQHYRRKSGQWIEYEDNAIVIVSDDGEPKGSEISGPIAREAATLWPRLASIASIII